MIRPIITFRYAPALDNHCRLLSGTLWKTKYGQIMGEKPYPSVDFLRELSISREKIWGEKAVEVIQKLTELLGFQFTEKEILVYTVGFGQAHSDPVIIPSNFNEWEFVNVATHELIHRFLTFNTSNFNEDVVSPRLFPNESPTTAIHVVVNALLQFVYINVLDEPQRLEWDKERSGDFYKKAWGIVEKEGYMNIIETVKAPHTARP